MIKRWHTFDDNFEAESLGGCPEPIARQALEKADKSFKNNILRLFILVGAKRLDARRAVRLGGIDVHPLLAALFSSHSRGNTHN